MALADREDALSDWLSERDVTRDWVLAPALAAAGADVDWCDAGGRGARRGQAGARARVGGGHPVLDGTAGGGQGVHPAHLRTSSSAVKSYAQLDRAAMQQTDLAEGLESTLVMLAHRIPADVTIVRDYGADVPRIEALAAELNQVWTNLIDNALDAMDGRGTLRVSTRIDSGEVVVEIGDTGAGMSPETQEHAFDPFYTTKGVGEGTGLGLDISRRIVDRHKGDISVQSRPGETVLRVRLPARGVGTAPGVSRGAGP